MNKKEALESATVEELITQLRKRGIEVAAIEETQLDCQKDHMVVVDNHIRIPWAWKITPYGKKILKKTGGPIITLWLDPTGIKPDSKITRMSDG